MFVSPPLYIHFTALVAGPPVKTATSKAKGTEGRIEEAIEEQQTEDFGVTEVPQGSQCTSYSVRGTSLHTRDLVYLKRGAVRLGDSVRPALP